MSWSAVRLGGVRCRSGGLRAVPGRVGRPRSPWLGGLGSKGGSDGVRVDQGCGPDGLKLGLVGAVVAAGAGVVAVDDQAEQPFDAWSGAFEVVAFGGVGELGKCGL